MKSLSEEANAADKCKGNDKHKKNRDRADETEGRKEAAPSPLEEDADWASTSKAFVGMSASQFPDPDETGTLESLAAEQRLVAHILFGEIGLDVDAGRLAAEFFSGRDENENKRYQQRPHNKKQTSLDDDPCKQDDASLPADGQAKPRSGSTTLIRSTDPESADRPGGALSHAVHDEQSRGGSHHSSHLTSLAGNGETRLLRQHRPPRSNANPSVICFQYSSGNSLTKKTLPHDMSQQRPDQDICWGRQWGQRVPHANHQSALLIPDSTLASSVSHPLSSTSIFGRSSVSDTVIPLQHPYAESLASPPSTGTHAQLRKEGFTNCNNNKSHRSTCFEHCKATCLFGGFCPPKQHVTGTPVTATTTRAARSAGHSSVGGVHTGEYDHNQEPGELIPQILTHYLGESQVDSCGGKPAAKTLPKDNHIKAVQTRAVDNIVVAPCHVGQSGGHEGADGAISLRSTEGHEGVDSSICLRNSDCERRSSGLFPIGSATAVADASVSDGTNKIILADQSSTSIRRPATRASDSSTEQYDDVGPLRQQDLASLTFAHNPDHGIIGERLLDEAVIVSEVGRIQNKENSTLLQCSKLDKETKVFAEGRNVSATPQTPGKYNAPRQKRKSWPDSRWWCCDNGSIGSMAVDGITTTASPITSKKGRQQLPCGMAADWKDCSAASARKSFGTDDKAGLQPPSSFSGNVVKSNSRDRAEYRNLPPAHDQSNQKARMTIARCGWRDYDPGEKEGQGKDSCRTWERGRSLIGLTNVSGLINENTQDFNDGATSTEDTSHQITNTGQSSQKFSTQVNRGHLYNQHNNNIVGDLSSNLDVLRPDPLLVKTSEILVDGTITRQKPEIQHKSSGEDVDDEDGDAEYFEIPPHAAFFNWKSCITLQNYLTVSFYTDRQNSASQHEHRSRNRWISCMPSHNGAPIAASFLSRGVPRYGAVDSDQKLHSRNAREDIEADRVSRNFKPCQFISWRWNSPSEDPKQIVRSSACTGVGTGTRNSEEEFLNSTDADEGQGTTAKSTGMKRWFAFQSLQKSSTSGMLVEFLSVMGTFAVLVPVLCILFVGGSSLCPLTGQHKYNLVMAFIPLSSAVAGNCGLQCNSLTKRAIVHGRVTEENCFSWMKIEGVSCIVLAIFVATVLGALALISSGDVDIVFAVSIALGSFINISLAGFVGTGLPILLEVILQWDAGKRSGPVITVLVDLVASTSNVFITAGLMNMFPPKILPGDYCQA